VSANERTFLSEAFAAAALSGLSRAERRTWDPALARDPRLLVPVDVRAMVVAPGEEVEHADSFQQEGPMTTFFGTDGRRGTLDCWSVKVASYRTDRIVKIRRRDSLAQSARPLAS